MSETQIYLIITSLLFSNLILAYLFYKEKKKKNLKTRDSFEVNQLLLDLMQGEAVIKCSRIVPTDIFLRSPRHGGN
jgi:hypothetical protein